MKSLSLFTLIVLIFTSCMLQEQTTKKKAKDLTYLALGDSYTIGEGVDEKDRYPNQLVGMLSNEGLNISLSKIIAKTGWTTDELATGIENAGISGNTYDMVTLLIGVNNQYRGRSIENYRIEFEERLVQAIEFAGGNPQRVLVLSIPDWGVTPFAVERGADQNKVRQEIDQYNASKKAISETLGVFYIDITEHYREVGAEPEMVVEDKLHPSGLVYKVWAEKLEKVILSNINFY